MYFPCTELLPFLKAVDVATKNKVNDTKFNHLGSNMLTIIVESLHSYSNRLAVYSTALAARMCDYPSQQCMLYLTRWYRNLPISEYKSILIPLNTKELLKREVLH